MKKIVLTLATVFALSSIVAFADDMTATHDHETKVDTSHNPLTGKTTTTRKHKAKHKVTGTHGKDVTHETTTTDKTTTDDNAHKTTH